MAGLKSLISGPKMPEAPKPVAMPDADSAQVRQARRRKVAKSQASGGRGSTVLSAGGGERLGA